jgi:hypothetical protein
MPTEARLSDAESDSATGTPAHRLKVARLFDNSTGLEWGRALILE